MSDQPTGCNLSPTVGRAWEAPAAASPGSLATRSRPLPPAWMGLEPARPSQRVGRWWRHTEHETGCWGGWGTWDLAAGAR
jgi:hypothetical protein